MTNTCNWPWWIALFDNSESWAGPYGSRDEAIATGRTDFDNNSFVIQQAVQYSIDDIRIEGRDFLEQLCESNEEMCDEDGALFRRTFSANQERDLGRRIENAIKEWASACDLSDTFFVFKDTASEEHIPEQQGPV